ncbi:hypothetical protein JOF53_007974 [Crossiella equi]|uniref:DUF3168 domain-containing protein n=1 Tax=Crossiella equi TaxID=130796 RepID=A0ABS5ASA6_9PSEU|nr:hypothetical protein [Crossiella equi]MBP2479102.1 hypothetical protein [Crossiella equi]
MSRPVPVPLDVAELAARLLRRQLGDGLPVSTELGRGPDGGPERLPWLLVAVDAHTWQWPAIQRGTVRLSAWHHTEHQAVRLVAEALGRLCDPGTASGALIAAEPATGPIPGTDPYTGAPLATARAVLVVRTPPR